MCYRYFDIKQNLFDLIIWFDLILFLLNLTFAAFLFLFLAESLNLHFGPGFNFFASDVFLTEHAHNLYRMSSNLRSIAYDLHYCPGSKNYRRQNKMSFSPELYIVALKKWMVYVLYIFNLYIYVYIWYIYQKF
jgi:hypothetical protein